MGPLDLEEILRPLTQLSHPNLLVGLGKGDDAAVYMVGDRAIVQTVDFFAPVVDDPYSYGAIAAANSMSDVYAMGGEVLFALNIAAFPEDLPKEIITVIVQGGVDKVREAGGVVAGGHTVIDREPKFGFCVTGAVDPSAIMRKGMARAGQTLVLTKPIGTGTITTALKAGKVDQEHLNAAVESMLALNRTPSRLLGGVEVRSCTDITGFGLLGHASEMAAASEVRFRIEADRVPLLSGAAEYAAAGILPGGVRRNMDYLLGRGEGVRVRARISPLVSPVLANLLMDPQTSGGLLAAVDPDRVPELEEGFRNAGLSCWVIGEAVSGEGVEVV